MSISKIGSDLVSSLTGRKAERSDTTPDRAPSAEKSRAAARQDRVELSAEGLSRAAEAEGGDATEGLDAARIEEIRDRIRTGFYDDPSVAEAVAHKLTGTGDLRTPAN